jgi:uncharacterized DUF497 family protein
MDVFVTRENRRFVWDSDKAASNIVKHGVTFDQALAVFFDPFHEVMDASVPGERREAAIGLDLEFKMLVVVHIEIEEFATRIISARQATAAERRAYEESQ